jgi:hypothetical protein
VVQFGGIHGLPHRACEGENARHLKIEERREKFQQLFFIYN